MAFDQSLKELHIDYSIRNGFVDAASNVAIRKFAIGALRGSPTKVTPKAPLDWIWLSCDVRFGIERLPVRALETRGSLHDLISVCRAPSGTSSSSSDCVPSQKA